jgi:hypothetical protein
MSSWFRCAARRMGEPMHRSGWTLGFVVAILVLPAAAAVTVVVAPSAPVSNGSLQTGPGAASGYGTVSSSNWAGYAVTGPSGSVSFVQGSWVQPTVTCTSKTTYSAFWVGIDGYSSRTVEQTGTEADCAGGTATYSAWYEFYPALPVPFSAVVVHPGDVFEASVTYTSSHTFKAVLKDLTTGTSGSHSKAVSSAVRTSAEWIAEAPCCTGSGNPLPLSNFGTASFGKNATGVNGTNVATISGTTGAIGSFGTAATHRINMAAGGVTKAKTSALTNAGTSFAVTWKHS